MFFVGVLGKEGYVHVAGDALFCYIEFKQFDPNAIESTFHLYIYIYSHVSPKKNFFDNGHLFSVIHMLFFLLSVELVLIWICELSCFLQKGNERFPNFTSKSGGLGPDKVTTNQLDTMIWLSFEFGCLLSLKLTVRTWKWMVGIRFLFPFGSFWGFCLFSGAFAVSFTEGMSWDRATSCFARKDIPLTCYRNACNGFVVLHSLKLTANKRPWK